MMAMVAVMIVVELAMMKVMRGGNLQRRRKDS